MQLDFWPQLLPSCWGPLSLFISSPAWAAGLRDGGVECFLQAGRFPLPLREEMGDLPWEGPNTASLVRGGWVGWGEPAAGVMSVGYRVEERRRSTARGGASLCAVSRAQIWPPDCLANHQTCQATDCLARASQSPVCEGWRRGSKLEARGALGRAVCSRRAEGVRSGPCLRAIFASPPSPPFPPDWMLSHAMGACCQ